MAQLPLAIKHRNRSELGFRARDVLLSRTPDHVHTRLLESTPLGRRGRDKDSTTNGAEVSARKSLAVKRSRRIVGVDLEPVPLEIENRESDKGLEKRRRAAIEYFFRDILGCPPEDSWKGNNIVPWVMNRVIVPRGSRASIIQQLKGILECEVIKIPYSLNSNLKNRGRKCLITHPSNESVT
jgi:hypothetical protein